VPRLRYEREGSGSTNPKVIAAGVVNAIGTDIPLGRWQGPGNTV
jgi:hypothetical protein